MNSNTIYQTFGTDYKEMTKLLLREADLKDMIPANARIGIKPNLVAPSPADFGATTHPEIVAGIIEYLRDNSRTDIRIIEGSWVGDATADAFEYCGYNSLADEYDVELVDCQKELSYERDCSGMNLRICNIVADVDFLINVPVLKGHCQTRITCALKNMKGLIPNSEKRRFHTLGLHEPIAHLNTGIKQNFIVIDNICGDHDFEEGGNPVVKNSIMCGTDPVLIDAYVCRYLGYKPDDVRYVTLARSLGVGSDKLDDLLLRTYLPNSSASSGADTPNADMTVINQIGEEIFLNPVTESGIASGNRDASVYHRILDVAYAAEDADSCSSCYAGLVGALTRLHDEGLLKKFDGKLCIGQGHRGKSGEYGIGNCTSCFRHYVKGCPPEEDDIYEAVKSWCFNYIF